MPHDMLYVALTRARDKAQLHFSNIDNYKPHAGYIYSYEFKERIYIGSTNNLNIKKVTKHGILN